MAGNLAPRIVRRNARLGAEDGDDPVIDEVTTHESVGVHEKIRGRLLVLSVDPRTLKFPPLLESLIDGIRCVPGNWNVEGAAGLVARSHEVDKIIFIT